MRRHESRHGVQPGIKLRGFARLHQAEMAFRQGDIGRTRQAAQHRHAQSLHSPLHQQQMPGAGDAIQHYAGNGDARIIVHAALDDSRRRLRLAADIDHQQHRHAERRRDIGRSAGAPGWRGHTVKQPHRSLANYQIAVFCRAARQLRQHVRRHRPGIEVDAGPPGGGGMKRRIDVIGAAFGSSDAPAALAQGAQQAQRQRRLAAA